ncbi:MAG: A/G-specific adenine glycosylase [Rhodanobacteraceae bacterium]|nr:A/G-specific adenine glycosylase [Rhodanobacteraceae bacterium]
MPDFATRLLAWFDQHGRHDLPWQHPRTPYRVWVAEVMLQQTQVQTVMPYYQRFLLLFPDLRTLASAPLDDVLAAWSGLGYYSRARNLHRAAIHCMAAHAGELPDRFDALAALPGIGRSTAGAILAQAHGQRLPILDGNVRRVLARHRAVTGDPGSAPVQSVLWELSQAALPQARLADYTQALMDLGTTVCTRQRPGCGRCPLAEDCQAQLQGRVGEFPQARKARTRPSRSLVMLRVRDEAQRILLRRRPPAGVWPGLWSLPEGRTLADALATLALAPTRSEPAALIRHEFTHFSLEIAVHDVHIGSSRIADEESRWLAPAEALSLGLPQPVRRLIERELAPELVP